MADAGAVAEKKPRAKKGEASEKSDRPKRADRPDRPEREELTDEQKKMGYEIVDKYLKDVKASSAPTLTVMLGAHGSGKDAVRKQLAKELGIAEGYAFICRENILKQHAPALKRLAECAKKYSALTELPDGQPTDEEMKKCLADQNSNSSWLWRAVFNPLYNKAKEGKFDVVFNMTQGRGPIDHFIFKQLKELGYKTRLVYVWASDAVIHTRVLKDAKADGYYNSKIYTDRDTTGIKMYLAEHYGDYDEFMLVDCDADGKLKADNIILKKTGNKVECKGVDSSNMAKTDANLLEFIKDLCSKSGKWQKKRRGGSEADHLADLDMLGGDSIIGGDPYGNREGDDSMTGGDGDCGCKHGGDGCPCCDGGECHCADDCPKCDCKKDVKGSGCPCGSSATMVLGGCQCCGGRKKVLIAIFIVIAIMLVGLVFLHESNDNAHRNFKLVIKITFGVLVLCGASCLMKKI
jgi:hypothetical protein